MNKYIVRTQHNTVGSVNSFIVPIEVEADSHFEAARDRFARLCESAQRGTVALLVAQADTDYSSWAGPCIFYVKDRGREVVR